MVRKAQGTAERALGSIRYASYLSSVSRMTEASEITGVPPKWVPVLKSPNPAGSPKGTPSKRNRVAQALNEDAPDVIRVVIEAVLAGDITAAGLVLSRIVRPINAQPEWVQFETSDGAPLWEQARQILLAASEGKLDADTARILITSIQSVAGIRAVEDLEARIITLEAKTVT